MLGHSRPSRGRLAPGCTPGSGEITATHPHGKTKSFSDRRFSLAAPRIRDASRSSLAAPRLQDVLSTWGPILALTPSRSSPLPPLR